MECKYYRKRNFNKNDNKKTNNINRVVGSLLKF